jgi:ABC-type nitrate/sulfonate/bicarbonate transport system substrate-binding protein
MPLITLQLDWKPNAQFAGILLAHHLGWYEQADIELKIFSWQSHTNPVDALATLENMIVSTEDNLLIQARAAGKPVKAIAAMLQYSALGWLALKSSGIRQMSDLRGKRLGIHADGLIALDVALTHFRMTRNDIHIVPLALITGKFRRPSRTGMLSRLTS